MTGVRTPMWRASNYFTCSVRLSIDCGLAIVDDGELQQDSEAVLSCELIWI